MAPSFDEPLWKDHRLRARAQEIDKVFLYIVISFSFNRRVVRKNVADTKLIMYYNALWMDTNFK